ncbi:Arm DNA-binding domain-containing protein [Marinobacter sp. F4216]|uniref:Arm DNA-binding domain-containing protein n=1 Tax=Marinobacter sp. F4216 TaxID=2874281 RepID=UPI001CC00EED|nr:site-specific integrase [Marinobacter sp. F4216]MBZ2170261.1 site-specific integrase [Marinobacter sp. F4216]
MGKIAERPETGKLFFDFRFGGKRCREQTALDNTPANRKKLENILKRIEAEITLGTFEYHKFFPNSPRAKEFTKQAELMRTREAHDTPLFSTFAADWLGEMNIQWRRSHASTVEGTLKNYLNPHFGEKEVGCITKKDILDFRASLAKVTTRSGKHLSASRINRIMTPLRMILSEAANRFEFSSPYHGIKSLRVPRTDVEPFGIDEVKQIIETVRADFRNYYTVRFFTGMRTGEIDGLQWDHVDFKRRQILVRQSLVQGRLEYTKNDGSFRTIEMSQPVMDALNDQKKATGNMEFVFCTRTGGPLNHNNVTKRVWYPLLRHLGLRKRRPYQTRHTAATLWLAAGENPEWIARQMGHTTTEMLFRVYSRYVPNLTRRDGSAFERLLLTEFDAKTDPSKESD